MSFPLEHQCDALHALYNVIVVLASENASSTDDLISPQQNRFWNRDAEGFGGFEVDYQLHFRRSLERKFSRFG